MLEKDAIKIYIDSLKNNTSQIKIKLSAGNGGKPFIRQLKGFNSVWGNCQFFINEDIDECDFWVVYGEINKVESVLCPKENTLFITAEPSNIKKYSKIFINQFATIITCQKNIKHPKRILRQQALPWWVGHKLSDNKGEYSKTYDELKSINNIGKKKEISVVVSNKKFTKGHRQRIAFVDKLKQSFGNNIDVFGEGFNSINDKWDAIAPYKYHIVLENSSINDYWTEKLSDAFLGGSYPIYYGCKNIHDYFPTNSLSIIDITKPDEAIEAIRTIIDSNKYEESVGAISNAKNLVLDKYQLFPMLAEYTNNNIVGKKSLITIFPEKENNIILKAKRLVKKILKK